MADATGVPARGLDVGQVSWVRDLNLGNAAREVALIVGDETVSPEVDGRREVCGICGAQPVLGPQYRGELGDDEVYRPQVDASQQAFQGGQLRRSLAARLAQDFGKQQDRAGTDERAAGLLKEAEHATALWMAGHSRVDESVRIEGVHLAAVTSGPDLPDEFLRLLQGQAGVNRKFLIASGHESFVQSCGLLDHDCGPRAQDVRTDEDRYRAAVPGDGELFALLDTREQFR